MLDEDTTAPLDLRCTETELLLSFSVQLAGQQFGTPTQDTVMRLFERLCIERDMQRDRAAMGMEACAPASGSVH